MAQHKVKIAARLRPAIKGEIEDNGVRVDPGDDGLSFICVNNPRDPTKEFKFPFTSCYGPDSTQDEIFEQDVKPLVDVVFSGSTVTIFAYGVTSSGKTHTMQGSVAQPGVIPQAVEAIFAKKDLVTDHRVEISMSYMEIYKDECYDLLVHRETAPKLPVREDGSGQVFVANLSSIEIANVEDFTMTYSSSNSQRSVGSTKLNNASSRSHAILTLEVKMIHLSEPKILTGKINLVDLAGSENNKLTGNNDASRMAESAAINKSLSVLGQVVHALNRGDSRIPYRNSKLTRILQDALGGASIGLLICNLAPGFKFRQDTLNTLHFATRTKNVENKPVINEKDSRPAPKSHFSAPTAPAAHLAPLPSLPSHAMAGPSRMARPSLVFSRVNAQPDKISGPTRVPRKSIIGTSAPYPSSNSRRDTSFRTQPKPALPSITEQDIDDRISKAIEAAVKDRVEAEVAKRMEILEKQRLEEERMVKEADRTSTPDASVAVNDSALSSSLLAPLLKRHQDLDTELRSRLEELEMKYERGGSYTKASQSFTPASRKKTGRAYVALARAHSEKGELQIALDLYRKAETYVPDNVKLKERIIDIEWAIKEGREFQPSPKRPRKPKGHKKGKALFDKPTGEATSRGKPPVSFDSDDDKTVENLLEQALPSSLFETSGRITRSMVSRFGPEAALSPTKRGSEWDSDAENVPVSPKRSHKLDRAADEIDEHKSASPLKALH